jgi:hypothetical protein
LKIKNRQIALWSGPRNLSTALMYSFISRGDLKVFDEPLFGYFLKQTAVWRPSREEALAVMETNYEKVIKEVFEANIPTFTKNIANHIEGLNLDFIKPLKNIILTRNPKEVLASYSKQIESPTLLDLAYNHQLKIIKFLVENKVSFLVIDSNQIKLNPEKELRKMCDFSEIEFTTKMLKWSAGPKSQDGVWAKYWYHSVHQSSGFSQEITKPTSLQTEFLELHNHCETMYQEILKYANNS